MDTSKEYILQCDCPEIQEQRPPLNSEGDDGEWWSDTSCHPINPIWLPRQDQLQDIIDFHVRGSPGWLLGKFNDFIGTGNVEPSWYSYIAQFMSMEQLWLAFVMFERHGKRWDGGKWL